MTSRRSTPRALTGLVAVLAAACSIKSETAPSQYYLLRPSSADPSTAAGPAGGDRAGQITLAVGPVRIASYLDRPQIVTRGPGSQVEIAGFHRWAEPLKDNIAGVLVDNLSLLVPTEAVTRYPLQRRRTDLRVEAEVTRFDGALGGQVVLEARWSLFGEDASEPLESDSFRTERPAAGTDYAGLVEAMSLSLQAFSERVAARIRSHARSRQP